MLFEKVREHLVRTKLFRRRVDARLTGDDLKAFWIEHWETPVGNRPAVGHNLSYATTERQFRDSRAGLGIVLPERISRKRFFATSAWCLFGCTSGRLLRHRTRPDSSGPRSRRPRR